MDYRWLKPKRVSALVALLSSITLLLGACGTDNPATSLPATTAASTATVVKVTTVPATSASITTTAAAVKTIAPVPNGNHTGVTETEIKLGTIGSFSGPLAESATASRTMNAYFNMINEQGGIYGRKIKFIMEDNAGDPDKTLAAAKKLIEQDQVLALAGPFLLIKPAMLNYFEEQQVPLIPVAGSIPQLYDPPRNFLFGLKPLVNPEGKFVVDYAADQLGAKQVAIISDGGRDYSATINNFFKEAQARQLKVVAQLTIPPGTTDFTSLATSLQQSGADFVYVVIGGKPVSNLLIEIDKLGYKPKVMLSYFANDVQLYQWAGKAAEGVYSSWFALQPDGDDLKSIEFREFLKKYAPGEQPRALSQEGYIEAQVMVEALRRAGKDLSREGLITAAESIINWRDSYANNITYGPLNRIAINSFYVTQYQNGKIQKVSDWYTVK